MASKRELESNRDSYEQFLSHARAAQSAGDFAQALAWSKLSWPHIDGMLQFGRKYEELVFVSVETIDIILEIAPALFDLQVLHDLAALLKQERRIEKLTSDDLGARVRSAVTLTWQAFDLWESIEAAGHTGLFAAAANDSNDPLHRVIVIWSAIGAVRVKEHGGMLRCYGTFSSDRAVIAKCSACGATGKGPMFNLLSDTKCPRCRVTNTFAILAEVGE